MIKRKILGAVLRRRECLLPTWRGWILILLASAGIVWMVVLSVQPFLALNRPLPADVMVVEGWLPDFALAEAATEFAQGHYRKLYVTGGPLEQGSFLATYKSYAELGAATLRKLGVRSDLIEAVPAPFVQKDRTIASALALKRVLNQQNRQSADFNLASLAVHARRSQMLFQTVFAPDRKVGIIALADRRYPAEYWWKYSQGVRSVVDELVAYLYAKFVFSI